MEDVREDGFQIATLVVVVATVIVVMLYAIIFVNPQFPLNPLKPALEPTATRTPLPATWTLTPTNTPTPTATPTFTPTPTSTPTPTNTPTNTPIASATRPRTNTPRPSPYQYYIASSICEHSGGTFIEGYVNSSQGPVSGIRVSYGTSPGGNVIETRYTDGSDGRLGHYTFVVRDNGSRPGTWYVWIVDATGKIVSDPNAARVVTNDLRPDNPGACWRAEINFGRR